MTTFPFELCDITQPSNLPLGAPPSGGTTKPSPVPHERAVEPPDAAKWHWYATRGKNLIAVAYEPVDGILGCRFGKSGIYRFRGVPEVIFEQLKANPYPDRLFTLKVKGKFPVIKPDGTEVPVDR